jgi:uncharacterized protein YrrD
MKWFEDDSCIISDEVMAMTPKQVKAELAKYEQEFSRYKSTTTPKHLKAKLTKYEGEFREYKSAANL